jgi:dephospho-CoA kinase
MDRLGLSPVGTLTLGLTGGIGSGKSTVAQVLVGLGAHLVDTDAIARGLTQPGGAAMPALLLAFGPQAVTPDGALNREHMRQLAFTDATAKQRLEEILHPLIGEEALRQATHAGNRPVVFDVPLLGEHSHWRARVHKVLVVDCPEDTQVARVTQRPGWDEAAARRVVALQASRSARRALADAVIYNGGISLQTLHGDVQALWQAWVGPQQG